MTRAEDAMERYNHIDKLINELRFDLFYYTSNMVMNMNKDIRVYDACDLIQTFNEKTKAIRSESFGLVSYVEGLSKELKSISGEKV